MSALGVWLSSNNIGDDIVYRQNIKNYASDIHFVSLEVKGPDLAPTVRELTPETIIEYVDSGSGTLRSQAPLEHLLTNGLILDRMAPYLQAPDLMALSATSREIHAIITKTPYVFRHLDLTRCRSASLRSQRLSYLPRIKSDSLVDFDDNADEEYSAPIRHIFSSLEKQSILQDIRTLILDGLSVPARIVKDIVEGTNVKILSIRQCPDLSHHQLRQVIEHAVRPERPEGTPKLKGIYFFSSPKKNSHAPKPRIHDWWASQKSRNLRAAPDSSNREAERGKQQNEWYRASGKVLSGISRPATKEWAYTLQKCEGIIAFDAVLCRGLRHDVNANTTGPPLEPALATVALGPGGCDVCHSSPEGPEIWSPSAGTQFPLLNPVPLHLSSVLVAQDPEFIKGQQPCLNARCIECLEGWCRKCNKWICSSCLPNPVESNTQSIAHACDNCKVDTIRSCQSCGGGFCMDHDIGSNACMACTMADGILE
ncbi:hypothetical protein N7495_007153 [Penicillium taxi]|uniref:uncharacterized protein n=1 Tax=Penicillium taxi TaxID=168475 RepID=UPI0025452C2D|nr:uncharacterized protein N7495_007153 [Penicillium taxi]KAJ5895462.1 hypothetical protein N7495_007153 [Penicillium taxi]